MRTTFRDVPALPGENCRRVIGAEHEHISHLDAVGVGTQMRQVQACRERGRRVQDDEWEDEVPKSEKKEEDRDHKKGRSDHSGVVQRVLAQRMKT